MPNLEAAASSAVSAYSFTVVGIPTLILGFVVLVVVAGIIANIAGAGD